VQFAAKVAFEPKSTHAARCTNDRFWYNAEATFGLTKLSIELLNERSFVVNVHLKSMLSHPIN
jgi:hypothetical protein